MVFILMKRGRDDGWRRKGGGGREEKRERKGEGGRERVGGGGERAKALYSMFCDGATAQYKTHFFTQVL